MNTGIGNHRIVSGRGMPYQPRRAECPYCGYQHCHAPHVNTGIGLAKVGLFSCPVCHASEISYLDTHTLTVEERRTGWYLPGKPCSPYLNGRQPDRSAWYFR